MHALMFYQPALFTECPITHFTCIWMLNPLYITGISAFSTLHVMFTQSTLVKTQRLNIRAYFDRKNMYFHNKIYVKYKSIELEETCYLQECI